MIRFSNKKITVFYVHAFLKGDKMVRLGNDWDELLKDEFCKDYYLKIRQILKNEYFSTEIYPPMNDIFNALRLTPYSNTKVVILGQDPYHEPGQAHGLSFSVRKGVRIPPSLVNIYKELHTDIGMEIPGHGDLTSWAKQGVLLLNATLTVRRGAANSHRDIGWSIFTDNIIKILNNSDKPVVFILWGANAGSKAALITSPKHLILRSAHPSPLSAFNGFFGSKPFSKTNNFLIQNNLTPINWASVLEQN